MARHPDVSEKEIIDPGISLEKANKQVNPGSVRVQLGNKGSFPRIRATWEKHIQERNFNSPAEEDATEVELPAEIEENLERNKKQAIKNKQ